MKYILIFLLFITSPIFSQSCCETLFASNDGNMAMFVGDQKFENMHPNPVPFTFVSEYGGVMINISKNEIPVNAFFIPSIKKSKKWLFVFQEWWGLNDYIKKEAEKFYADLGKDVNVLAIDMYDGKVATTREQAGEYMKNATPERLETILKTAKEYAGKRAKIATVGWCFGGAQSLKSSIINQKNGVGCVMYYGMPVLEVDKLKMLNCDVLGLFATEQWISKEVIENFAKNMNLADKKLDYKIYDAAHAFANPSNPKFDEKASADAYSKALAFLKARY